jgi:hypothetical protein
VCPQDDHPISLFFRLDNPLGSLKQETLDIGRNLDYERGIIRHLCNQGVDDAG